MSEGAGVRSGNVEIHPGIGAEGGFDSNFLLRSSETGADIANGPPQRPPVEAGRIRITPSISLSTLGQQRGGGEADVTFRGTLHASYLEFFGGSDINKQRNLSIGSGMRLNILPGRPVGFGLQAGYNRLINPNVLGNPDFSLNQNQIMGGADVTFIPGGGTLTYTAGYMFTAALFETSSSRSLDYFKHEGRINGSWRFTPRTALLQEISVGHIHYREVAAGNPLGLQSQSPVKLKLGISGQLTSRLSVLAMAGYGGTFIGSVGPTSLPSFSGFIGDAQLTYFLTANPGQNDQLSQLSALVSSIALGYQRTMQQSFIGNFNDINRGYLSLNAFIGGRALLTLNGGVSAYGYPSQFDGTGTARPHRVQGTNTFNNDPWTDIRPDIGLFGEYRFTDSFAINATVRYSQNISSTQLGTAVPPDPNSTSPAGTPQFYDLNWRRVEAFAGVRWFL